MIIILLLNFSICFLSLLSAEDTKTNAAVMDLEAKEGITIGIASILSDSLRTHLLNTKKFTIVERENMKQILKEQTFQLSGCTSDTCIVEAGQLLSVRKMFAGSIGKLGTTYVINLKIIDVQSGQIEKSEEEKCVRCEEDALPDSIKKIANKIIGITPAMETFKEKPKEVTKEVPIPSKEEKKLVTTGIVAKVNDKPVTAEYFNAIYEKFLQDFRTYNPGSPIDKETVNWAKRYVLDEIIKRELILQEAKRMKFNVSDVEVEEKIKEDPFFRGKDGKFDKTKYLWAVNNPNVNWKQIRDSIREELLYPKFQEYMTSKEKVSDKEVLEEYAKRNEKVKIQYTIINLTTIPDTEITNAEVEAYFNEHREDYRLPPRVKARYLLITPDDIQEDTGTTQEEIRSYYDKNIGSFQEPERVKLRHIMIAIPTNADTKILEEKQREAEEILKKLKEGADFAEIALKYSQDFRTAARGGDIGYLKRGAMNKEMEDDVFSLKPGQISRIEKTSLGFHIFKVDQKKPAGIADFEEVKDKVKNEISKDKKEKKAYELTESIFKKVKSITDLETKTIQYGKLIETPFFSEKDSLDTIGYNPEFNRSAFALKPGEIDTKVLTLEWRPGKLMGFAILGVTDRADSYIPSLKDVVTSARNDYKKKREREVTLKSVDELKVKLKNSTEFETIVKENGLTPKEITFTRSQYYIEGLGYVPDLVRASFDSPPLEVELTNIPEGTCLYRAIEKIGIDEKAFIKEKEELKKSLIHQKNTQAFEKWYEDLKGRSKITIYLEGYQENPPQSPHH